MIAVGLMSGTSLDGVDAALVRIRPLASAYGVELIRFEHVPYDDEFREGLLADLPPQFGSTAGVARLHHSLGLWFAQAVQRVIGDVSVDFVASHGQTLWHDGKRRITLQVGDAFVIREAIRATVCYDFRSADCAAGGHGAPLVPYVDALLLASEREDRVALNLGGIANVTLLRRGASPQDAVAFDTGPANMLLDVFISQRAAGKQRFDDGGELARRGRVDDALLRAMLTDPHFHVGAPKSTGRERFGAQFLAQHAERLEGLSIPDGAATLVELTAVSVADAISRAGFRGATVIVSGGGARNAALLERLAERLEPARVETSDAMGLPADAKEAMAFVVLGYETLRGHPANVPSATGAAHPAVLGAIAPYRLRELLERMEDECKTSS